LRHYFKFGAASNLLAATVFVLAPLPLGSVDLAWVCIWTGILAVSLLAARIDRTCTADLAVLAPIFVSIVVIAVIVCLQMWPNGLAGLSDSAWRNAREQLGADVPDRVSLTSSVPWLNFGYYLLFALGFSRAYLLATDARQAQRLLHLLAYSGLCYALYGIFAQVFLPETLLWRQKEFYLQFATGTFVNRNTAATFWGSCGLIFLIQFVRAVLHATDDPRSERIKWLDRPGTQAACCAVCLIAVGMTGSRAGILVTFLSMFFAVILYLVPLQLGRESFWNFVRTAFVVGVVGLALVGAAAMSRISEIGLVDAQRLEVYTTALKMIRGHELLGFGLGNFEAAFPLYRPAALGSQGIWDRVHSIPIELAIDLGIPAALCIFGIAAFYFVRLVRGALARKRDRHIPVVGAGVFMLGMLHSCVDFSLQIPGYGILFASIVGCGLAQSISRSARPAKRQEQQEQIEF